VGRKSSTLAAERRKGSLSARSGRKRPPTTVERGKKKNGLIPTPYLPDKKKKRGDLIIQKGEEVVPFFDKKGAFASGDGGKSLAGAGRKKGSLPSKRSGGRKQTLLSIINECLQRSEKR